MPERAGDCYNKADAISLLEWDEEYLPDVKLRIYDIDGKLLRTECFDRSGLIKWINGAKRFIGYGKNQYFIKLPTVGGDYVTNYETIQDNPGNVYFDVIAFPQQIYFSDLEDSVRANKIKVSEIKK